MFGAHLVDADVVVELQFVETHTGDGGISQPATTRRQSAAADVVLPLQTAAHTQLCRCSNTQLDYFYSLNW